MIYILFMGTVFEANGIKFIINTRDHNPPHVHVVSADAKVRINLETLDQMDDTEFSAKAVRMIIAEVIKNHDELMEEWRRCHE